MNGIYNQKLVIMVTLIWHECCVKLFWNAHARCWMLGLSSNDLLLTGKQFNIADQSHCLCNKTAFIILSISYGVFWWYFSLWQCLTYCRGKCSALFIPPLIPLCFFTVWCWYSDRKKKHLTDSSDSLEVFVLFPLAKQKESIRWFLLYLSLLA